MDKSTNAIREEKVDIAVIVPHQDDELVIAGPMIFAATKKGMNVKVIFVTNGDYNAHEGPIRMREAMRSLAVLGVKQENILFLGYGDQTGSKHLYNGGVRGGQNEILPSHCGINQTYGIEGKPDFAMVEYGEHHVYTRENYKMDIKAVLKKFLPNVLITTDWDDHMDHIALSLMIDECVGELLREMEYTPLILKAQAYTGRWEGNPDYYSGKNVTENVNGTFGTENVHPLNKWGDRIRFAVPKECNTRLLRQNILYRAACEYKSQGADVKAIQFVNSDIIYWRRRTESLSYHADIIVSSGEGKYLNDFKCLDCTDIVADYRNYDAGIWMPEETDVEKSISITFEKPVYIQEICLYENPGKSAHIQNMSVKFEDGESLETGELESDGSCTRITLPQRKLTGSAKLKILSYQGVGAGLTEIEIYDIHKDISEYCLPLSIWSQKDEQAVPQRNTIGCRAEKLLFALIKKGRGRVWPNKWLLMQKYDDLQEHDPALRFWCRQIRFVMGRIIVKVRGR